MLTGILFHTWWIAFWVHLIVYFVKQRFQKTYEALEQEGLAEKKQLTTLHQQRVQTGLNEHKRRAMEKYMQEINHASPDVRYSEQFTTNLT